MASTENNRTEFMSTISPSTSSQTLPAQKMTVETIDIGSCSGDDYDERHDEMNILLLLLKRAYFEHDLLQADAVVETMVSKSHVISLKPLHTVCGYGIAELVEKYLKDEKCDPNVECSFDGLSSIVPLHFCAGIGPEAFTDDRDKCVELLVAYGADINRTTSRLDTALHWATKLADFKVCEKLVKLGADVNKLNMDNCTCAHGAAFYKNIQVLEMLIENNCDVNVQDVSGKTIIHLLCKVSFEEDYVIAAEASTFSLANEAANQAAAAAAIPTSPKISKHIESNRNKVKLVKRLITELNMSPNLTDEADFNALMYACEQDNVELVQVLIDCGANVNFINKDGVTCMILAIVNSCSRVVKLLLKNKFDLFANASANFSYITDAAYLNDAEILNTLIEAGCDVNETKEDEGGVILNPLWAACERGNLEIVELLLSKGARTLIREDLQMTALHCACMAQYECLPIVKLLVEHKCPINVKSTSSGETPLFLASNSGFSEIVEYLLSLGVDANESSSQTRSCFQQAVFRGHKEIITLLIEHGYKLSDEDRAELDLYLMDLYQEDDVEMLNYLLGKSMCTKEKILEAIRKVNDWRVEYYRKEKEKREKERDDEKKKEADDEDDTVNMKQSTSAGEDLEDSTLLATLSDLKLEADYPTTIEELDAYLACNPREIIQLSDDND